jgi:pimeloyl-ACP methyl ester carboxylesterase
MDDSFRAGSSVVLVHGAIVNGWEMVFLRRRLRKIGYRVRQFHYHSILCGLDENVERLRDFLQETPGERLHVVGHSMGGILIRHLFERFPDPRPGRVVALASPFLDCWVGRRVSDFYLVGSHLIGRTVRDHLAGPRDSVWRGGREIGVVAGTFPFGIGSLLPGLPRPSDGVVLWEETRLGGITDHLTYRLNHFGMLGSSRCAAQITHFLEHGAFAPPN